MDVHGDLNLNNNYLIAAGVKEEINFPSNPQPGRIIFKDKSFYICTEIAGGLPVWVPLAQNLSMYIHNQPGTALEWAVNHGLNTSRPLVQVFDTSGYTIIPDYIQSTSNTSVLIGFSVPFNGTAVILRGITEGTAPPNIAYEQTVSEASDTWVINHALGYNPIVQVIVNNQVVQPLDIVFNSVNTLTVTFSAPKAGTVRCI